MNIRVSTINAVNGQGWQKERVYRRVVDVRRRWTHPPHTLHSFNKVLLHLFLIIIIVNLFSIFSIIETDVH